MKMVLFDGDDSKRTILLEVKIISMILNILVTRFFTKRRIIF